MFVVADQRTLGIGRQGRLAGTRQTEKHGDIAILALVCRRMQGQHIVLNGHLVEENGEDTLLHLAGIFGSENDHLLLGEIDGNRCRRGHTLCEAIGREGTSIVNDIVWVEVLEILARRANEHIPHEKGVVGTRADNPHANSVPLIPACKPVNHVDAVARVEIVDCALSVDAPDLSDTCVREIKRQKKGGGARDVMWCHVDNCRNRAGTRCGEARQAEARQPGITGSNSIIGKSRKKMKNEKGREMIDCGI